MQKVLSFLKRSLSVAFLFAVLFSNVQVSAADTYKGPYPGTQCLYLETVSGSQCKAPLGNSYTPDPDTNCRRKYGGHNMWWQWWSGSNYGYYSSNGCYVR